jgi:outer membrane protein TolC
VRAYERRADLRAHHSRIMAFAAAGVASGARFPRRHAVVASPTRRLRSFPWPPSTDS